MLKRTAPALAATAIALTAVVGFAAPAHAAAWDGNNIEFGPGEWQIDADTFGLQDVNLMVGGLSRYTDLWDGAGKTSVVSEALTLNAGVWCSEATDLDVSVEVGTGDLVITCQAQDTGFAIDNLTVTSEIRIFDGGEVVRFLTTIANGGVADAPIDEVIVRMNFGSSDFLYDYQNQSDDVLAVPAPNDHDYATELNSVGAKWAVNWDNNDAPGGVIIGGGDAEAASAWRYVDGSDRDASVGPFTVPAGEARAVAIFATWDPQTLIAGDYDNEVDNEALITSAADSVVSAMGDFAALSGVLANGLDPEVDVVNWGLVDAEEEVAQPELAETGAADVIGLGAGAVILAAIGALIFTRRRVTA